VKFTPAGPGSQVRRAVGGFLRYVQHRDLHPTQPEGRLQQEVSGLVKYVAYRDRASARAELFGANDTLTSDDRKAFAGFVGSALDHSRPQLFRGRDGQLRDRRRAVYRLVISPERGSGLDLRGLTFAVVSRLERESGITGLQWIAAVHRNTAHHHVHLVIAGMHDDGSGYRRVDLTKQRLAAMKEELALEIGRQRAERTPHRSLQAVGEARAVSEVVTPPVAFRNWLPLQVRTAPEARTPHRRSSTYRSVIALRTVAGRYQRRMERELEDAYRQAQWDQAA
jgi:hypothetical protein